MHIDKRLYTPICARRKGEYSPMVWILIHIPFHCYGSWSSARDGQEELFLPEQTLSKALANTSPTFSHMNDSYMRKLVRGLQRVCLIIDRLADYECEAAPLLAVNGTPNLYPRS